MYCKDCKWFRQRAEDTTRIGSYFNAVHWRSNDESDSVTVEGQGCCHRHPPVVTTARAAGGFSSYSHYEVPLVHRMWWCGEFEQLTDEERAYRELAK